MVLRIFDKILFAFLLIISFQIPVLSDHYLQFLSGYFESIKNQVKRYEENAKKHEYSDIYAMIDDFSTSGIPAVRYDAAQKLQTMKEYEELKKAINIFKKGNIFQRIWYMFNPNRGTSLKKVLENFSPAIPLGVMDIIYCTLAALFINLVTSWVIHFGYRKFTSA